MTITCYFIHITSWCPADYVSWSSSSLVDGYDTSTVLKTHFKHSVLLEPISCWPYTLVETPRQDENECVHCSLLVSPLLVSSRRLGRFFAKILDECVQPARIITWTVKWMTIISFINITDHIYFTLLNKRGFQMYVLCSSYTY